MLQLIHYPEVTLYEVDIPSNSHGMINRGSWYEPSVDMEEWLLTHAGERTFNYERMRHEIHAGWCVNVGIGRAFFQFRDKQVATLFKLTWSGR